MLLDGKDWCAGILTISFVQIKRCCQNLTQESEPAQLLGCIFQGRSHSILLKAWFSHHKTHITTAVSLMPIELTGRQPLLPRCPVQHKPPGLFWKCTSKKQTNFYRYSVMITLHVPLLSKSLYDVSDLRASSP